jgi:hypothetical protein
MGGIRLRVLTAGGGLEYSRTIVFFRWSGFDEGDKISGDGSAEFKDDGTIENELETSKNLVVLAGL